MNKQRNDPIFWLVAIILDISVCCYVYMSLNIEQAQKRGLGNTIFIIVVIASWIYISNNRYYIQLVLRQSWAKICLFVLFIPLIISGILYYQGAGWTCDKYQLKQRYFEKEGNNIAGVLAGTTSSRYSTNIGLAWNTSASSCTNESGPFVLPALVCYCDKPSYILPDSVKVLRRPVIKTVVLYNFENRRVIGEYVVAGTQNHAGNQHENTYRASAFSWPDKKLLAIRQFTDRDPSFIGFNSSSFENKYNVHVFVRSWILGKDNFKIKHDRKTQPTPK